MFNRYLERQFESYNQARRCLVSNPHKMIDLENHFSGLLQTVITRNITDITADYDEASYLYPFWKNYPPEDRGRQPKGDQFPWIEVGEHAIGCKLLRLLCTEVAIRDIGLPTGADQRFVIKDGKITEITEGLTDSCFVFIDIKSVGPRDDQDHTVMSHNQISGSGHWRIPEDGVKNNIMQAIGTRSSHEFHCSIPPIYVLSDGTITPVLIFVIKPVYKMVSLNNPAKAGQPLSRITLVSIPNGLLLEDNPGYLSKYPNLLFPGKDDKGKNPLKVRCRISFPILRLIDDWRVREIPVT